MKLIAMKEWKITKQNQLLNKIHRRTSRSIRTMTTKVVLFLNQKFKLLNLKLLQVRGKIRKWLNSNICKTSLKINSRKKCDKIKLRQGIEIKFPFHKAKVNSKSIKRLANSIISIHKKFSFKWFRLMTLLIQDLKTTVFRVSLKHGCGMI